MSGKPGRSGTNKGQDRPFKEALLIALKEADGDHKKLRRVAEALIAKAIDGDVQAIREIADRTDGKPRQENEHTGPGGGPLVFEEVRRIIVDTANPDAEGVRPADEAEPV